MDVLHVKQDSLFNMPILLLLVNSHVMQSVLNLLSDNQHPQTFVLILAPLVLDLEQLIELVIHALIK